MESNFDETTLKNKVKNFYSQYFEKDSPFHDEWSEGRMKISWINILATDEEKKYFYLELFCEDHSYTALWELETSATCLMWRGTSPIGNDGYSFSNGYVIQNNWSSFNLSKITGSTGSKLNVRSIKLANPVLNVIGENKFSVEFDWNFKEVKGSTIEITSK